MTEFIGKFCSLSENFRKYQPFLKILHKTKKNLISFCLSTPKRYGSFRKISHIPGLNNCAKYNCSKSQVRSSFWADVTETRAQILVTSAQIYPNFFGERFSMSCKNIFGQLFFRVIGIGPLQCTGMKQTIFLLLMHCLSSALTP